MLFELTEEHQMIRHAARDFAISECLPGVIHRDENQQFPYAQIEKLADLGFMGMMVSPEFGGAGLDTVSYVLALEEVSKIDASVAVCMSVNNSLVCWGLEAFGSEAQKHRYLTPLAQLAVGGIMIPQMKARGYGADYAVNVTSMAALIALAALAAARRDRLLWAAGALVYAATAIALAFIEFFDSCGQSERRDAHYVKARVLGCEEHPDLSIRPAAVRGKPQEALVEEAARTGARLLVVGNVGMKGLGRVLGSVASSVAHNAPCDVLIVKTDE